MLWKYSLLMDQDDRLFCLFLLFKVLHFTLSSSELGAAAVATGILCTTPPVQWLPWLQCRDTMVMV